MVMMMMMSGTINQRCSSGTTTSTTSTTTTTITITSSMTSLRRPTTTLLNAPRRFLLSTTYLFGVWLASLVVGVSSSSGNGGGSIKCGDLRQCTKLFRSATNQTPNISLDFTEAQIEKMCLKLHHAVNCFNVYNKHCPQDDYHRSKLTHDFHTMADGALGLTMELCNNDKFKRDYLTIGPCHKRHQWELDQCVRHNHSTTNATMLEQFIQNCCTLHNYHNCIYDTSLDKCGKDAAEFSLKILELFNRGSMRECGRYANLRQLCSHQSYMSNETVSSGAIVGPYWIPLLIFLALVVFACGVIL